MVIPTETMFEVHLPGKKMDMHRTFFHAAGFVPVSVTDYSPFECILNGPPIQVPTVDRSYSGFTDDLNANGVDSAFATQVKPYDVKEVSLR